MTWRILFLLLITSSVQAQILSTVVRGNYNYFIYVNEAPSQAVLKQLPRGAIVQYNYNQELQTTLVQNTWPDSNKSVYWYRHNMLLHKCTLILYANDKEQERINFWPNAELVFVDNKFLDNKKYRIKIVNGEEVLEARELVRVKRD
jgi:hypothetical protein